MYFTASLIKFYSTSSRQGGGVRGSECCVSFLLINPPLRDDPLSQSIVKQLVDVTHHYHLATNFRLKSPVSGSSPLL